MSPSKPLSREKSKTSNYGDDEDSCDEKKAETANKVVSSSESKKKKTSRSRRDYLYYFTILFISAVFYLVCFSFESQFETLVQRSQRKEWLSFATFYPYYVTQHTDFTCKSLHFLGTSIISLMIVWSPDIAFSFAPALLVGLAVRTLTIQFDTGLIEGLMSIGVFLITNKLLSRSSTKGITVLVVGYGFAWVGHFIFEKNRPATFTYPVYSLIGDFKMWFELLTTQRSFK